MTATNNEDDSNSGAFGLLIGVILISIPIWLVVEGVLLFANLHPGTSIWRFVAIAVVVSLFVLAGDNDSEDSSSEKSKQGSKRKNRSFYAELKEENNKNGDINSPTTVSSTPNSATKSTTTTEHSVPVTQKSVHNLSDALQLSNHLGGGKDGQRRLKNKLQSMNEYDFEQLVGDLWKRNGWKTNITSGSGDRGIDVIATRSGMTTEKQIIQAKRYAESNTVGSQAVRNYATLHQQESDVDSVVIVTTSRFTKQATQLAKDLRVKLVDGDSLCRRISQLAENTDTEEVTSVTTSEQTPDVSSELEPSEPLMVYGDSQSKVDRTYNNISNEDALRFQLQGERWISAVDTIAENGNNKIIEPVADYLDFLDESVQTGDLSREDYQYHRKRLAIRLDSEYRRINDLQKISIPDGFNETESLFRKYVSETIDLYEITNTILEKGINNVSERRIDQWNNAIRSVSSLTDSLERRIEIDSNEIQRQADRISESNQ